MGCEDGGPGETSAHMMQMHPPGRVMVLQFRVRPMGRMTLAVSKTAFVACPRQNAMMSQQFAGSHQPALGLDVAHTML